MNGTELCTVSSNVGLTYPHFRARCTYGGGYFQSSKADHLNSGMDIICESEVLMSIPQFTIHLSTLGIRIPEDISVPSRELQSLQASKTSWSLLDRSFVSHDEQTL